MKTVLIALALLSSSAFAAQPKVNVCHVTGDGSFRLLNIAQPAVQAHINHGDILAPAAGATVTVDLGSGITVTLDSSCSVI